MSGDAKEANSERPPDSDFQQQNLKAWQPLLTPSWVIVTFFLVSVIFIPIGAIILDASSQVVEYEYSYWDKCQFDPRANDTSGRTCPHTMEVRIMADMKAPVYMYYKLTNFYQNHRRYVKSREDKQLRGDVSAPLTACDPLIKANETHSLYPCGLIANSYFNDSFANFRIDDGSGDQPLEKITDQGIAWDSDKKDRFKDISDAELERVKWTREGPGGFTLPKVTNEDFIVWMRTAGLPNFKKLRYRILQDLKAGDKLKIDITNAFPVAGFKGTKSIVISTTSWLGGKNDFLGYAYVIVGGLCFLLAFLFLMKHFFYERPLGDMHYFNWHSNRERKE